MPIGGRLAAWGAVLLATLMLGVPAGAQSLSESGNPQTTASQNEDSETTEPEATEADPGESVPGVQVVRYDGSDPYALSIELAGALAEARGGAAEWVVLASGESWAEAAVAGPLAASLGAPVLLAPPGGLQSTTARSDLVTFLRSAGTRRAVIVGSPVVLPNHEPSLLFGLGMLPRNIERVYDDDPVGTSIAVAKRIGTPAKFEGLGRTVIIASDRSVADAVAVGPLAAAGPFPLLLTAPDALDQRISAYLAEHEIAHVVLVGGTVAVTPETQDAMEAAGVAVTRLAGRDRTETAKLAADLFNEHIADAPKCAGGPTRLGFAPAQHPGQALTAGPLLAAVCTPLRYTESGRLAVNERNALYLASHRPGGARVVAFADETQIADGILRPSVPPVRIAAWRVMSEQPSGEREVVLVVIDEHGNQTALPDTEMVVPARPGFWNKQLSWAPDGRWIAYRHAANHDLRVVNLETGELFELRYEDYVPRLDSDLGVEWSPNSSLLLFAAFIDDDSTVSEFWAEYFGGHEFASELFVFDVATQGVNRLTHNDVTESPEQWNPNGRSFSYYDSGTPFTSGLPYTRKVNLKTYELDTGQSYRIYGTYFRPAYFEAQWSRDGERIAFSGTPLADLNDWRWNDLFVADYNGENLEQLTPSNCPECAAHRGESPRWDWTVALSWSRDNQRIAYYSDPSLQVHDFGTGSGQVLIPVGESSQDVFHRYMGDLVGWSTDDEFLYVQGYDLFGRRSVEERCRISGLSTNRSGDEDLDDRAIDIPVSGSSCGYKAMLSPDGSHFAVIYPQSGLRLFGIMHSQWQVVQSEWRTTETAANQELQGCSAEWTTSGVLGRCDYLRTSDSDG
ncbi:cell wall-binding repeat-containing protein [Candidatus Poriferisodalis sp.]|uniref:cell wall-binding repeat-containing protein n=1 Tax=Candidatus Poriferisodalis sp. TaxID=3101277 RepID=UPI003B017748